MAIQIFGVQKCFETKKAARWFKERGVKVQFINLAIKGLSKGELQSVAVAVGINSLINTASKEYERSNLARIISASVKEEILLNNPKLYKTPIVRNGRLATVGYAPEVWTEWPAAVLSLRQPG
jgi:arsenate reductase